MTTIDNRVVQMDFDNQEFESGIKTSVKSLENLKEGLKLEDSVKGLTSLNTAGKNLDLTGISEGVKNISDHFSAMGIVGMTVISNLATAAIDLAVQLGKSLLGIDNMQAGFAEYESSMQSMQTILANTKSKGTTFDDVNKGMAEMNLYANQTKYSFGQMTDAMGKFTAQGVTLDDSIKAIKGIFNIVSLTGGGANEAATAIEGLSRGIAQGSISTREWMSIVSAGFGGPDFQNQLIQTGKAFGVNVDAIIKKAGSFRDSLSERWISADIMIATLQQYTTDLSAADLKAMTGVTQATQKYAYLTKEQVKSLNLTDKQLKAMKFTSDTAIAIGANYNADQLKKLGLNIDQIKLVTKYYGDASKNLSTASAANAKFTDAQIQQILQLGQDAQAASTTLKTFGQMMDVLSSNAATSWSESFKIIVGDINEASSLWTNIGNTIGTVLQNSSDARNKMLTDWKKEGGRDALVNALTSAMKTLVGVMDAVKGAFAEVFPPLPFSILANYTIALRTFIQSLAPSGVQLQQIKQIFIGLFSILDVGLFVVEKVFGVFKKAIGGLKVDTTGLFYFLSTLGEFFQSFDQALRKGEDVGKVIEYFGNFFPVLRKIGSALDYISRVFNNFNKSIKMYGLMGFANALSEELAAFAAIHPNFKGITDAISNFVFGFVSIFGKIKIAVLDIVHVLDYELNGGQWKWGVLGSAGQALLNFSIHLKTFITEVSPFFAKIRTWFTETFKNIDTTGADTFMEKMKRGFSPLVTIFGAVGKILGWLGQVFMAVWPIFSKIATVVGGAVGDFAKNLLIDLKNLDYDKVFDTLNKGLLSGLMVAAGAFFASGAGAFAGIGSLLTDVKTSLYAWQLSLDAKTLMMIAKAIGIIALSLIGLALVDPKRLTIAIAGITAMFAELTISMTTINASAKGGGLGAEAGKFAMGAELMAMAGAVLILSAAVAIFASLDPEKLTQGLVGVGVVIGELAAFMKLTDIEKISIGKGASLILVATAINIVGIAVGQFAKLDTGKLAQGLIGVGVVLAEVATFTKVSGGSKNMISTALGLTIIAGAMLIFSNVVATMGSLPLESLVKGLAGMALSLLIVAGAVRLMPKNMIIVGAGLTVVAYALTILATALKSMGDMGWEEIVKGITALAASLLVIAGAMTIMPKNMIVTGAGLAIVAYSLTILAKSLKTMGGMSWEEIAKGIVALSGSMAILALALKAMKGTLDGAAAMLVMAAALAILTPVLVTLGDMKLEEIGTALLVLAGVFVIIGIAGLVLAPMAPAIAMLAGAIALLGIAAMGVGIGMLAFSAGLAALAVTGTAGSVALTLIVTTLLGLLPMLVVGLVNAIVQIAVLLAKAAPTLALALTTLLGVLITAIGNQIPTFVTMIVSLITTLLATLTANAGLVITGGLGLLTALLKGISDNIGNVVTGAVAVITGFVNAIADNLDPIVASAFGLILKFIEALTKGVDTYLADILTAAGKLAAAIIQGIVEGIGKGLESVINAVNDLGNKALAKLKEVLGIKSPSKEFGKIGEFATQGLVNGLLRYSDKVGSAAANIGDQAISGLTSVISQISDAVSMNIDANPMIRPVLDLSDVVAGSKQIGNLLGTPNINVSGTASILPSIANGLQASASANTNPNQQSGQSSSISLTQNNYSPKALSRYEIYRQTQIQVNTLKGLVKA